MAAPRWRLRHDTARPDIVGPDQPQAVDPLGIGDGLGIVGGVHAGSLLDENGPTAARGEGGHVPSAWPWREVRL